MNDDRDERKAKPDEVAEAPAPERGAGPPEPAPPELATARPSGAPAWSSGARPGRWATIGCGLGIVILIAALFAGSTLLRRTVWTGFAGARQRLVANLPGDLPPGERMRLTRNLDRFTVQLEAMDDPYPVMGEFHQRLRSVFEDGRIDRGEVAELDAFLESHLPAGDPSVPYSMP